MIFSALLLPLAAGGASSPGPAPAAGKWSVGYTATSCESDGHMIKSLGKNVTLADCKAACVANPQCGYVNHADDSDKDCFLYADCPTPICRAATHGWWYTYEYGRTPPRGWPGCVPAGPAPPPPSPGGNSVECVVKQQSLVFASKLTQGRAAGHVYASLGFPSGCAKPPATTAAPRAERSPAGGGPQLFVSPGGHDVNNTGLAAGSPLRTLHAARDAARALKRRTGKSATINLMAGRHYVSEPVELGAEDSGSPGEPVVWRGEAGSTVSGGVPLSCSWTRSAGDASIVQCDVKTATLTQRVDELFVNGVRRTRARYPNGDPLIPRDGYASGCSDIKLIPTNAVAIKANVTLSAKDGTKIATIPYAAASVTVADRTQPRSIANCKIDQTLYRNTRYNETYNQPYWDTDSLQEVTLTDAGVKARMAKWASPEDVVVKMYHPGGWGSWAFISEKVEGSTLTFKAGGNQEARGGSKCGGYYVENVREELDAANEWFYDTKTGTLYFFPDSDDLAAAMLGGKADVAVSQVKTVWQVMGSVSNPAHDIVFKDANVTQTAPTYLDHYEVPSGGDWSVHRGAAVFVHNAERITLQNLKFDQVGGNAVMFSSYVKDSNITDSDFWRTGDSAVLVLGSSMNLAHASANTYPQNTLISNNWIDSVGIYMKQTSCVFKSQSYKTTISNNVCYNGPRAGVNFNDAFKGGDVVEGNLIFNMVRESGDHGTFNSWDRRDWVWPCASNASELCMVPEIMHLRNNMFIGPAGWNVDHDDGSSYYWDYDNTVYQGHFKYRDGDVRNMTGNLMISATPVFQVTGFSEDYFVNNMMTANHVCGPDDLGALTGTIYLSIKDSTDSPNETLAHTEGGTNCDNGTHKTITFSQLGDTIQSLWPKA